MAEEITSLDQLPNESLLGILSHVAATDPKTLASLCCTNRVLSDVVRSADPIWRSSLSDIFLVDTCTAPDGTLVDNYYTAFQSWWTAFRRYSNNMSLVTRALDAWRQIEAWTFDNMPEIYHSLRPGASEEQLDAAEQKLHITFPPELRVLYRIHDGQDLEFDRLMDHQRAEMIPSLFHGMFGGYSFYNHHVSTRMLSLKRMLKWTPIVHGIPIGTCLFAASFNFGKVVCCNITGKVAIPSVDKLACFPAVRFSPDVDKDWVDDTVLCWFESYACALTEGRFGVENLVQNDPESRSISLFPRTPPLRTEAITNGVRVTASPLFVPELSKISAFPSDGDTENFFAYRVGFSLLSFDEQLALGIPREQLLKTVQLETRRWDIRNSRGDITSQVQGEAVVGEYPLLEAGGTEFVYQSCTHQKDETGSMGGGFTFVEGSRAVRGPREFEARCETFQLQVPDVIF